MVHEKHSTFMDHQLSTELSMDPKLQNADEGCQSRKLELRRQLQGASSFCQTVCSLKAFETTTVQKRNRAGFRQHLDQRLLRNPVSVASLRRCRIKNSITSPKGHRLYPVCLKLAELLVPTTTSRVNHFAGTLDLGWGSKNKNKKPTPKPSHGAANRRGNLKHPHPVGV